MKLLRTINNNDLCASCRKCIVENFYDHSCNNNPQWPGTFDENTYLNECPAYQPVPDINDVKYCICGCNQIGNLPDIDTDEWYHSTCLSKLTKGNNND